MRPTPTVVAALAALTVSSAVPSAVSASAPPSDPGGSAPVDIAAMDPDGVVADAAEAFRAEVDALADQADGDRLDLSECPLATLEQLTEAVAAMGDASAIATELDGWFDEYESLLGAEGSAYRGVTCRAGDPAAAEPTEGVVAGVGVAVLDFTTAPEELENAVTTLTEDDDVVVVDPSADSLGGTLFGECAPEESGPDGTVLCLTAWVRDELQVTLAVVGAEDLEPDAANDALVALIPELLAGIAGDVAPATEPTTEPPTSDA